MNGKKGQCFLTAQFQLINSERMMELKNGHLENMTVTIFVGKNHLRSSPDAKISVGGGAYNEKQDACIISKHIPVT